VGFRFTTLDLPEVVLVEPDTYPDARGFFRETYRRSAFAGDPARVDAVQVNCSRSSRGVLRGMHFQREPAGVGKLVSVLAGRVYDVAADVRPGSPTFGRWVSAELSAEDGRMLSVPRGFAHGFCALADDTVVMYVMTGEFSPEHDTGVRWDDPELAIDWPVTDPVLSDKDRGLPFLKEIEAGVSDSDEAAEEARR